MVRAAKELHFNKTGETLKRMQAGVDKLATVVGVTLGPKVRASSVAHTPLYAAIAGHMSFLIYEGRQEVGVP